MAPNPSRGVGGSTTPVRPHRVPKPLPTKRGGKSTSKPPRYRPATKLLQDIKHLQETQNLLIPRAAFARLVREVTVNISGCNELRYQAHAIQALQEAAEAYLVGILEDSYLVCLHAKRVTLMAKDMRLAYRIRGDVSRYGV